MCVPVSLCHLVDSGLSRCLEALPEELDSREGSSHNCSGPSGQLPGDLITPLPWCAPSVLIVWDVRNPSSKVTALPMHSACPSPVTTIFAEVGREERNENGQYSIYNSSKEPANTHLCFNKDLPNKPESKTRQRLVTFWPSFLASVHLGTRQPGADKGWAN